MRLVRRYFIEQEDGSAPMQLGATETVQERVVSFSDAYAILRRLSAGNPQQITHADRAEIGSVLPPESDIEDRIGGVAMRTRDSGGVGMRDMAEPHYDQPKPERSDGRITEQEHPLKTYRDHIARIGADYGQSGEQRETRIQGERADLIEGDMRREQDILDQIAVLHEAQRSAGRVEAGSEQVRRRCPREEDHMA